VLDSTSRVSVVLTCFNEGDYIGAAVESVLTQTRANLIDSIVIADDGSDEPTLQILRRLEASDPRIKVLYGGGGNGLPAQRNLAIAATSSPVLAILDGDDVWSANKLELMLPALKDADVGLVYSGYYTFGSDDLTTAHQARVRDITGERHLTRAFFLNDPPIIPSTVLLRRRMFDACGRFDPAIEVFEDTDLYIRLSRICKFAYVERPLLYKRSRMSSITGSRKDLMAFHGLVAFKAAAEEPQLLALVPRRLAERARKLGNHRFILGDREGAGHLLRFAVRLDPLNARAWGAYLVVCWFGAPARLLLAGRLRARRLALGVSEN
jgi:glycosyltransferase involved in cell wall biosynthesis